MLKYIIKFLAHLFFSLIYRIKVEGLEYYDRAQAKILCPNHINYQDPLVIGSFVPGYIHFMAKKEIFSNRLYNWFFRGCNAFPVDRGGNDIGAVKTAMRLLKDGETVLIFAEGTRNPGLTPLPPKPGVGMIAYKSGVPIQPVTIDSTYKLFSKLRIIIHPPVHLKFESKPTSEDYEGVVSKVLETVYHHIHLYKGRAPF